MCRNDKSRDTVLERQTSTGANWLQASKERTSLARTHTTVRASTLAVQHEKLRSKHIHSSVSSSSLLYYLTSFSDFSLFVPLFPHPLLHQLLYTAFSLSAPSLLHNMYFLYFSWFWTGSVLTGPGSTDGGTSAELDSLCCDPVPTLTVNNAAWEGPTDAPQHVLTGGDGRGSTRGRKWGGGTAFRLLIITSKAPDGRHSGPSSVNDASRWQDQ